MSRAGFATFRGFRVVTSSIALAFAVACGGSGSGTGGGGGGVSPGGSNTPPPTNTPDPTPVRSLSATLSWDAASGPVAGYHVLVSRNDSGFTQEAQTNSASVQLMGAPGEVVRVRVAAFDVAGNMGPLSSPSEPFVFVGDPTPPPSDGGGATSTGGGTGSGGGTGVAGSGGSGSSGGGSTDPAPGSDPSNTGTHDPHGVSLRGDLDGDGADDLVWLSDDGTLVRVTSADLATARLYSLPSGGWQLEAVGDFDGDGAPDLLFFAPGQLAIAPGSALRAGPGALTLVPWATLPDGATFAASGDFDGDGKADVAVVDPSGVSLWLAADSVLPLSVAPPAQASAAAGDADGDGHADLVWISADGASLWRIGGGGLIDTTSVTLPEGASFGAFADLDGDGAAELALRTAPDALTRLQAVAPFASAVEPAPSGATLAGCGDYDGDGTRDRLWSDATGLRIATASGEQTIAQDAIGPWHLFADCH